MASAENSVQIKVSFNHQEQVLPLTIRPSLELTDLKVDAAEDELDQALRRAFDIQEDDTFYLHEAESGRILTKETFRDPGYCSSFPTHWYLVVERREKDKTGSDEIVVSERITKEEEIAMNHSNVEREMASMFQLGEGEERGDVDDEEYSDSHERNGGVEVSVCVLEREREREGGRGGECVCLWLLGLSLFVYAACGRCYTAYQLMPQVLCVCVCV